MQNTYQNRHGTFYIRLFVPKILHPHVTRTKFVQSLRTKDRKQAYLRSLQICMAFETWVADMTKKLGLDDFRELTVTLPSGVKLDFDLSLAEERSAYEDTVEKIGVFRQPEIASGDVSPVGQGIGLLIFFSRIK